jgi:hypothetical protein
MSLPSLRPLSFGEILDGAFTLYRRNFPLFVGTSLLLSLALVAVVIVVGRTGGAMAAVMPGPIAILVVGLVSVAVLAMATLLWGTLTWQASQAYVGRPVSLGEGMRVGGRSAMTLAGAVILGVLAFGVTMYCVGFVMSIFTTLMGSMNIPALSIAAAVLALAVLIASFFLIAALFFAVVPAVVLEELGPLDAIVRSLRLAQGALARITGVMAVTLLISYLPVLGVLMLTGGLRGALSPWTAQAAGQSTSALLVEQLLTWLVGLLTTPFVFSVLVLLYYDRRVRTEALDVQMLTDKLALAGA